MGGQGAFSPQSEAVTMSERRRLNLAKLLVAVSLPLVIGIGLLVLLVIGAGAMMRM